MSKKENWVDFKQVKARVSMEMVLARYGLLHGLKRSGRNLVGCCPIHKGSNPKQFSVSLDKNAWNCFGNCKGGGNVLDLVAKVEGVSVREAALLLQEWFAQDLAAKKDKPVSDCGPGGKEGSGSEPERTEELVREKEEVQDQAGEINPPLTFVLKGLDPEHKFFQERGIEPATIEHFGLGYCSRGLMKDRIAIPIHDELGRLVAYCGRAVSEKQIEEQGKYKLPPQFVKSAVVYNLHRQAGPDLVVLVESFVSVWWLYQAGFQAIALIGSSLSDRQEELILEALGPKGRVVLMFDADEDGWTCTENCLARLGRRLFVKAVDIGPYARKPHQLPSEAIKTLLASPGD